MNILQIALKIYLQKYTAPKEKINFLGIFGKIELIIFFYQEKDLKKSQRIDRNRTVKQFLAASLTYPSTRRELVLPTAILFNYFYSSLPLKISPYNS